MTQSQNGFWGYHLMLDCGGLKCNDLCLNDTSYLKQFVLDILDATEMKAWGEPIIAQLTESDGEFPDCLSGFTVIQLLHTSNMTLHICDKVKTLYFDLFSCKQFKTDNVFKVVDKYFNPSSVRVNYITRQS